MYCWRCGMLPVLSGLSPILFGLQVGGAPIIYPLPPWKLGMIPPTLERNLTGRNGPTVVDFGGWKGHLKSSSVIPWIYCIISWRLLNHQNTCVFLCRSNRGSPSNSAQFLNILKSQSPMVFFFQKNQGPWCLWDAQNYQSCPQTKPTTINHPNPLVAPPISQVCVTHCRPFK